MITPPSPAQAATLRSFFEDAGYTRDNILSHFGPIEVSRRRGRNRQDLIQLTAEPTVLNILFRWFMLGNQVAPGPAQKLIPGPVIEALFAAGFLKIDNDRAIPQYFVEPGNGMLFASDAEPVESMPPENFVTNFSLSAQMSLNFALDGTYERGLDLGCGCGIIALHMAKQCERVVATDIVPNAIAYTLFNARLNGIENIEGRVGSAFEPVAGETFDWIVSNPPFFMSPKVTTAYSMSGYLLDGFCAKLAGEAQGYLADDGVFQFLGEWVRREGQDWQVRPGEWFDGCGCDVWANKFYEMTTDRYTATRMTMDSNATAEEFQAELAAWRKPFVDNNIAAVNGAMVMMRKRDGQNWLMLESEAVRPDTIMRGDARRTLEGQDFLTAHDDAQLLESIVKINPASRTETTSQARDGEWRPVQVDIYMTTGARRAVEMNTEVANFLAAFDGDLTVGEAIDAMAAASGAPRERIEPEALRMVRRFVERGYLLPEVAATGAGI